MSTFSIHIEQVYTIDAADEQAAKAQAETWRTGGIPADAVADYRTVYVTDENGEEVE